ncbi:MAG TPA: hypothetical protein VF784_15475 [Anaerolineales bacterium]
MKKAILGAILALSAATMACSIFVGGPVYPAETPSASTPDTRTLQEQLQQALTAGAQSGVISLQITEGQLTSFLANQLSKQPNSLLSDPRVYLHAGQMQVYGKAASGILAANVSITLQASVDAQGQPQITVTQTDFGPLTAPQGFNDAVAASVREALTGWLGPVATGFRLDGITIGDGVMTVTGRVK